MARSRRKRPRFNRRMNNKLTVVFVLILIVLFALCVRLAYINTTKGDTYTIQVLAQQQYSSKTIPYKRGSILDCNGNVLATSVKVYNLIIDPKVILTDEDYLEPTVSALVSCFGLDEAELRQRINDNKDSSYIVMLKKLEYEEIAPFEEIENDTERDDYGNIKGVWFETEYERKYPYSTLGCKVIGFTYSGNAADWGIEGYYSDELNGVDGREYGYVNSDNTMEKVIRNATNGYNVVSTIDMNIQKIVEDNIASYNEEINAQRIAVIVANPNTGEILAMADDTTYDLNNPRTLTGYYSKKKIKKMSDDEKLEALNEIWRNYCISDSYEPGSTIKPFTIAAALEENVISEDDTYYCDGGETIGNWTINCAKVEGHGTLTLSGSIANSCNDALMQIGSKLGASLFSNYQTRFGFGVRTGIDLVGETPGLIYSAEDIGDTTLATNSFGQNFTVNMVQMVAGFSSLVNGGYYYQPHVVKEIVDDDGNVIQSNSKVLVKQTITSETSAFIKSALRETVVDGTGFRAEIEGYTVGGKTGTAEKTPRGSGEYVLSFIGCVPCEDPEVVCYVLIDTPEEDSSNSAYATTFFNNIMSEVLPYMNIFESETSDEAKEAADNTSDSENYSDSDGIIEGDDSGVTDEEGSYGE